MTQRQQDESEQEQKQKQHLQDRLKLEGQQEGEQKLRQ